MNTVEAICTEQAQVTIRVTRPLSTAEVIAFLGAMVISLRDIVRMVDDNAGAQGQVVADFEAQVARNVPRVISGVIASVEREQVEFDKANVPDLFDMRD